MSFSLVILPFSNSNTDQQAEGENDKRKLPESTNKQPEEDARARRLAEAFYGMGLRSFDKQRFQLAAMLFEKSFGQRPTANACFSAAICYHFLGQQLKAYDLALKAKDLAKKSGVETLEGKIESKANELLDILIPIVRVIVSNSN